MDKETAISNSRDASISWRPALVGSLSTTGAPAKHERQQEEERQQ
jgi:hypothetical protein